MSAGKFGVVVLTRGGRVDELDRAVGSVLVQQDVELDVAVVANGCPPPQLPAGVATVTLAANAGIPGGRNAGAPHVTGDLLFFLDDDACLPRHDMLAAVAERFAAEPDLGVLQPRVADPTGRPAPRRWTPRPRVGDPARAGDVTALWEGAVAVRRSVFEAAGGWPVEFFYAHEGIDLAWRVWDLGYRVHYDGALVVHHPAVEPTRHGEFHRFSARNRVWLARRHLPAPLAAGYLVTWTVITIARLRSRTAARDALRGAVEGITRPCGPRRVLSWRTLWRMTRTGRPPVI